MKIAFQIANVNTLFPKMKDLSTKACKNLNSGVVTRFTTFQALFPNEQPISATEINMNTLITRLQVQDHTTLE